VARNYRTSPWERVTVYALAVFIVIFVVVLLFRNEPFRDPNQVVLIRTILSLAVAALGATVPGFLEVGLDGKGVAIRAGGAMALFVVTFFFTPKVIAQPAPVSPPIQNTPVVPVKQVPDVSGYWTATIGSAGPQGLPPGRIVFVLDVSGSELLGAVSMPQDRRTIKNGKLDADQIAFTVETRFTDLDNKNEEFVPIQFRGIIHDADAIDFTMQTNDWGIHPGNLQKFRAARLCPPLRQFSPGGGIGALRGTWDILYAASGGEELSSSTAPTRAVFNSGEMTVLQSSSDESTPPEHPARIFRVNDANVGQRHALNLTSELGETFEALYGRAGDLLAFSCQNSKHSAPLATLDDGNNEDNLLLIARRSQDK
jgi:hypothetical protein